MRRPPAVQSNNTKRASSLRSTKRSERKHCGSTTVLGHAGMSSSVQNLRALIKAEVLKFADYLLLPFLK
jgi:hypothetical protein